MHGSSSLAVCQTDGFVERGQRALVRVQISHAGRSKLEAGAGSGSGSGVKVCGLLGRLQEMVGSAFRRLL